MNGLRKARRTLETLRSPAPKSPTRTLLKNSAADAATTRETGAKGLEGLCWRLGLVLGFRFGRSK